MNTNRQNGTIISSLLGFIIGFISVFKVLMIKSNNEISGVVKSKEKMENENHSDSKHIKELALKVHIAEFDSIRHEIGLLTDLENRLVNYGVVIIGGLVAVQSIFSQDTILLIIASMLLSSLSWALAESEIKIHDLGNYSRNDLIPRIQAIIGHENIEEYLVLRWSYSRNRNLFRILLRGFTGLGKFLISFIPSIFLNIIFYVDKPSDITFWEPLDRAIFYTSVAMIMVIPIALLLNIASNLFLSFRRGGWRKYLGNKK